VVELEPVAFDVTEIQNLIVRLGVRLESPALALRSFLKANAEGQRKVSGR
jgi:hypothetical protein